MKLSKFDMVSFAGMLGVQVAVTLVQSVTRTAWSACLEPKIMGLVKENKEKHQNLKKGRSPN